MTKGRELFALEWVKGEILGTLGAARQSLEAYAEHGHDETRMRACLTGLHQVHGSLVMLELPGIALLADHLERLAQALLGGKLEPAEAACQVLMEGILELPVRLERIQDGHPDSTVNALAPVNRIRSLLGLEPMQAPRPVQFEAGEAALARFERIDGATKIRRIRSAFQGVLLGVLKGESPSRYMDTLRKVGTGLERICQDTPSEALWQCFGEFVDSLQATTGPLPGECIKLLRRVDNEIRRFGQEGVEAILAPVPEKLLQQLIDRAAANGRSSTRLETLRSRIEPVDEGELIASGREALVAASHALVDELASVKDQVDLLVRSPVQSTEPLAGMLPVLRKMASTCSLLGFESSRVVVLDQVEHIERVLAGSPLTRELLFGVAAALVQVEENFNAVSASGAPDARQAGVSGAERQVLAQARAVLEGIKQAVVAFVGNGFDRAHLEGVPQRLHDLASVLSLSGFDRPGRLLEDCRAFLVLEIAGYTADDVSGRWERLDRFADSLSGIDYHLERVESRAGGRADDILDIVERNLTATGYLGRGSDTPHGALVAPAEAGIATLEPLPDGELQVVLPEAPDPTVADAADASEADHPYLPVEVATPTLAGEVSRAAEPDLELAASDAAMPVLAAPDADVSQASADAGTWPVEVAAAVVGQDQDVADGSVSAAQSSEALTSEVLSSEVLSPEALSPEALTSEALPSEVSLVDDSCPDGRPTAALGVQAPANLEHAAGPQPTDVPSVQEQSALEVPVEGLPRLEAAIVAASIDDPSDPQPSLPEPAFDASSSYEPAADRHPADVATEIEIAAEVSSAFEPQNEVRPFDFDGLPMAEPAYAAAGHPAPDADRNAATYDLSFTSGGSDDLELAGAGSAAASGLAAVESAAVGPAGEWAEEPEPDPAVSTATGLVEELAEATPALPAAVVLAVAQIAEDARVTAPADGVETEIPSSKEAPAPGMEFDLSDARFDSLDEPGTADDAADDEIRDIFLEEAGEVLTALAGHLAAWATDLAASGPLRECRRGFHTLKGSGRVAGALQVGELAWAVENMLNRALDGTIAPTEEFIVVARQAHRLLPELLSAYAAGKTLPAERIAPIAETADVLASGGTVTGADDDLVDDATDAAGSGQPEERELFVNELQEHVSLLRNRTGRRRVQIDDELLMALHTSVGSAGLLGESRVARVVELLYEVARSNQADALRGPNVEVEVARLFQEAADGLERQLPYLRLAEAAPADDLDALVGRAEELLRRVDVSPSEEGLLGLAELDFVLNVHPAIAGWGRGELDAQFCPAFVAAMQGIVEATFRPQITDVAKALMTAVRALESTPLLSASAQQALLDGCDRILQVVDAIATDRVLPRVDDVVTRLGDLAAGRSVPAVESVTSVVVTMPARPAPTSPPSPGEVPALEARTTAAESPDKAADDRVRAQLERESRHMDADLAEVFFEECDEILESLDGSVQAFCQDAENLLHLEQILRGLHTLKGSARLAGLALFGDRVHQFESVLSALQVGEGVVDAGVRHETQVRYDEIANLAQVARTAYRGRDEVSEAAAMMTPAAVPAHGRTVAAPDADAAVVPLRDGRAGEVAVSADGTDMVRVRANLLENLVNLAGESSILRARVEQGINDFTVSLDEMETTIERLAEQLRRLEIETDTQVLYRTERADRRHAQFDPLEMDRYSQLQQLTRALSESASDMRDLKDTLILRSREAETILLQQARVNTELQEGLMRTRMVPFNRLVPRLNRIVRQVAAELGKDVEFHVFNAEGELDRNLLERMVPPLEHMLRNAVDHGIETNNVRRSFGKPLPGRIDLRLSREGGDIVIEIADDGMGIDVESVRAKAMERGLLRADAVLADDEVLDFVLTPGFSTAKSVTQISGRGVGLDVVNSEVKQLGGSVSIFSTAGRGSRFVLRLPFTVSVNRALMVMVGDDQYAVPLNTIEGIVLVDAATLQSIYASDDKLFEYAGLGYRVRYLGRYLGRDEAAATQRGGVPLVLVRAGEQSMAIAVDGVQGSREIVVKSLGPQFAGVGGISGATILGDGSVVIILDLVALIRSQGRDVLAAVAREGAGALRPRCVMVVDDSVTVRKVTSRLLERQGMDVIVAKDGVEAMSLLGERTPDVMLLDIEMPRMDGFEVARQVRHDVRMAELPIIMISSRTGQKHQDHARSLGINRFLGKPFQENELLAAIDELAERR